MTRGPWLVTGATGFLGRHVLSILEHAPGDNPPAVALVREAAAWSGQPWTAGLRRTTPLVGPLLDPSAWQDAPELGDLSGLVHLAALVSHSRRDAERVFRTNVEGTVAMVRLAARRRCRMVFVSTSGTVGCFREEGGRADEDAPFCEREVARWPYYASKIEAEKRARALASELGVELVILRPPVLLGPGDHRFRSTAPLIRYLRGRLPFVVRGGMHFADVRDAAAALVAAMTRASVRPVYHLPGTVCSIPEFFAMASRAAGGRPAPRILPFPLAWGLARMLAPTGWLPDPSLIEMASHHWAMQSRHAGPDLGYAGRPGTDTMTDTVAWLRAHHPALQGAPPATGPRGGRNS